MRTAFHAKVEVGGATTNGAGSDEFKAMVNIPLIDDQLALRVVGFRTDQGGWSITCVETNTMSMAAMTKVAEQYCSIRLPMHSNCVPLV